jgi:hypothetical protein
MQDKKGSLGSEKEVEDEARIICVGVAGILVVTSLSIVILALVAPCFPPLSPPPPVAGAVSVVLLGWQGACCSTA